MRTFAQKPKTTRQTTPPKSTTPGRANFGQRRKVNSMLLLQRTIGNRAVQRLLRAKRDRLEAVSDATESGRFGHDFSRIRVPAKASVKIQSKLAVNTSGDIYEQEADRISEQVMRMPEPQLQRACPCGGGCPNCRNTGMIQMEPAEEIVEEPSAEDEAADREFSEALKDQIHDQYLGLILKIAKAQSLGSAERRQQWINTLASKPATMLEAIITKKEPLSMWEVVPLHDLLNKLAEEVDAEDAAAYALWESTNERYAEERSRLEDEGDYESDLALKYLDEAFGDHARRIDAIAATGALVQEDILSLVYILATRPHVNIAKIVAEREYKEIEALLDELSEVQEESPGFLETAWSIVGCDSVGECLGDVALTFATGGTGKAVKLLAKGAKVGKKAGKARKVVRSAKKLASTLRKFLKETKTLNGFISVVKGAAGDAANTYAKWLKNDWKKIATKISTDLIANYTTGEKQGAVTVSTARINKAFIETLVENEFGIAKPDPELMQRAIVCSMAKKHALASFEARTFILQSLKFRTTVNLTFELIRVGTPLTEVDEILKRTVTSTIAEAAQDTVQQVMFVENSELLKYITEVIRKITQRTFG